MYRLCTWCSSISRSSGTFFLLIAATFWMILFASSVLPCPSSHLADSGIHLQCGDDSFGCNRNTIQTEVALSGSDDAPDVQQHKALHPSQDVLGGSPVPDDVDHAGRETLSQSCKLLTQAGRQRPLVDPNPLSRCTQSQQWVYFVNSE